MGLFSRKTLGRFELPDAARIDDEIAEDEKLEVEFDRLAWPVNQLQLETHCDDSCRGALVIVLIWIASIAIMAWLGYRFFEKMEVATMD